MCLKSLLQGFNCHSWSLGGSLVRSVLNRFYKALIAILGVWVGVDGVCVKVS